MALVPIRIDRTSKPPLGTPLRSDGHWSVQGLVGAWAFNEGTGKAAFDGVAGVNLIDTSGPYINSQGLFFPSSAGNMYGTQNPASLQCNNFTILSSITPANVTANRGIAGHGQNSWYFRIKSTSRLELVHSQVADLCTSSSALAVNVPAVVGVTYKTDGNYCFYNNGRIDGTGTITPRSWSFPQPIIIGADYRPTPSFDNYQGFIHWVYIYSDALSPAEIASLSANPWQIYEPDIVWIEVPDGAGEGTAYTSSADAGSITLTGSTTTNHHAYVSAADSGAVVLVGSTATAGYRGLVSPASTGVVVVTGSTSTDYRNLVSSADIGAVTLTGYVATGTVTAAGSYTSIAATGTITLTGSTATDYRTLSSGASAGAVALTGYAATDTITEPEAYTSEAAAGTVNLTGSPATTHRSSAVATSAIQLVGSDATGYFGFTSGAEPSAVIITGAQTSALRTWISGTAPGNVIIIGYDASGVSPIYEISKIFVSARLSGPSATGRITTPTIGIRLT